MPEAFKQCGRHGNLKLSWKCFNMHAYQVSSPCVVQLASLKSEEVILKKSA